jgi:hypothetical protein
MLRHRLIALAGCVLLAPVGPALALEPTTVQVEGVAVVGESGVGAAAERAFRDALIEAVLDVARLYLPPAMLEDQQVLEQVRTNLAPRASNFVLTYRRQGAPATRPSRDQRGAEEVVLGLTVTIDAAQVRAALADMGLLEAERDRPSLVLAVRSAGPDERPTELFNRFEQYLSRALEDRGYVIVDPALHPGGGRRDGSLELARELGADLGIDLDIEWQERERDRGVGGTARVRLIAWRARDGTRLATARFDAPAYHEHSDEALLRALEALQSQVADNLILQLERNWRALARGDGPVVLQISNVSSFLQVEAVQRTLTDVLGAERAELIEIGPGSAELTVKGRLSPGALQDRLAAVSFEGFSLVPVEVQRNEVRLRVVAAGPGTSDTP